jgi:surfeit locus 1 family protein
VAAIALARHWGAVAPFFIDAEAGAEAARDAAAAPSGQAGAPVAGLTVIAFRNDHLLYAITWYTLALMLALASGYGLWTEHGRPWQRGRPASEPAAENPLG